MKILIAVDFSEKSENLVAASVKLLQNAVTKVCLLHVAEPDPDFVGYSVDTPVMRSQVAQGFHQEHQQLQAMANTLREQGIEAKALLVQGETGQVIVEQAEKLGADAIIVGASAHGALYHFILGDTIQDVMRESGKPVFIMPVKARG